MQQQLITRHRINSMTYRVFPPWRDGPGPGHFDAQVGEIWKRLNNSEYSVRTIIIMFMHIFRTASDTHLNTFWIHAFSGGVYSCYEGGCGLKGSTHSCSKGVQHFSKEI